MADVDPLEEARLLRDPDQTAARAGGGGSHVSGSGGGERMEAGKLNSFFGIILFWIVAYHAVWIGFNAYAGYLGVKHLKDKPVTPPPNPPTACSEPIPLWLLVSACVGVVHAVVWIAFSVTTLNQRQEKAGFLSLLELSDKTERTATVLLLALFILAWNIYGSILLWRRKAKCPHDIQTATWWYLVFSWTAFPVFALFLLFLVWCFLRKKALR